MICPIIPLEREVLENPEVEIVQRVPAFIGMVSLLDMLEFAAKDYVEIAHQLGLILATFQKRTPDAEKAGEALRDLLTNCVRLGLMVTRDQIGALIIEAVKRDGSNVEVTKEHVRLTVVDMNQDRFCHHLESIYSVFKSELGSIIFRAIPKEKAKYCDPKWLTDSLLFSKYPDTVDEFQRAGRCYAYGENTACIFHLMRVTDFVLKKVADSIGITYSANNWGGIGDYISKKMQEKYQQKTDDWKKSEPFYAEILTDIQAISRGHRNPALHELEKKYDEREALYMLTVIERFCSHVAAQL